MFRKRENKFHRSVAGCWLLVAGCWLQVAGCWLLVAGYRLKKFIILASLLKLLEYMNSYKDLEVFKLAFELAVRIHKTSLELPKFELYEQGSQIRRSSKSIKDQIVEGYGRRRYKADFIKFLVYSQSSCDETQSQLDMLENLYPEIEEFKSLITEYDILGKKLNSFIDYVENNWRS